MTNDSSGPGSLPASIEVPERFGRFLADLPVQASHTGRTLQQHLEGTYAILKTWGSAAHICDAGLFHSIYGTRAFPHVSLDESGRPLLRELIGAEAEALVYAFHLADWSAILQDSSHAATLAEASPGIFEVAVANLVEQMPSLLATSGDHSPLWRAARAHLALEPWLSEPARRDLRRLTDSPE